MTPLPTPARLREIANDEISAATISWPETQAMARTLAALLESPGKVSGERALVLAAELSKMADDCLSISWGETATLVHEAIASRAKDARIEELTHDRDEWQARAADRDDECNRRFKAEHYAKEKVKAQAKHIAELEAALKVAQQFINNGIELGFISLPEDGADPAHDTRRIIAQALRARTEDTP